MKDYEVNVPAKSWTRKLSIGNIVFGIIFLAVCGALVVASGITSPGRLFDYAVPAAILGILGALSNRFKMVGFIVEKFAATYFLFFLLGIVTLGPLYLFGRLSQFVLKNLTFGFQLVVFVVWGLLLTWALLLIATERNRERLFNRLQKIGHFTPVIYSLDLLMIALMFFSSVTFVLTARGALKFNGPAELGASYEAIAGFYLWHFLEAVPLFKVNETLGWKAPLAYDGGWTGFVLLLFKLTVIVPVIAAFAWYWKQVGGTPEKR